MANRNLDYVINLMDGNFSKNIRKAQNQVSTTDGMFKKLGGTIAAAFGGFQAVSFIKESTDVMANIEAMDTQMKVASRTDENFAKNKEFLGKTISDLKLPLMETTEGFNKFIGSVRGTALEGQGARDAFQGVAIASKAMNLSNDQSERVFGALGKMMSTGVVQADEFGGMLAEALPGAAELGAKSMGMSMETFRSEMEKGNINAGKFVTQFSALLEKEYGSRIPESVNTVRSKIIEMNNAIMVATGEAGEGTSKVYLMWLGLKLKLIEAVSWLIEKYEKYSTVINLFLTVAASVAGMMLVMRLRTIALTAAKYMMLVADLLLIGYNEALASGMTKLAAVQQALNIVMNLNPAMLIATAIAVLIGVVIWAYNEFETFRAIMDGLWNSMKTVFSGITNWIMAGFYLFTGQVGKSLEYAKKSIEDFSNVGKAFEVGYNASIKLSKENTLSKENGLLPPAEGDNSNKPPKLPKPLDNSVSAGRSVRNVTVSIENLVREINITTNNIKEGSMDVKKQVQDALIRAVLDSEAAL